MENNIKLLKKNNLKKISISMVFGEKNIEKIQFDNLKFGIYFSKCKKNGEKVLVVKNKKKVRCGNYFINGRKKEFYSDLYFLVFHQEEKDRNIIFENLIEKILGIIRIKDTIL